MIKVFREVFKHPNIIDYIYLFMERVGVLLVSDHDHIRKKYRRKLGRELNINTPQTFNEKVIHRILIGRKRIYTQLADKYLMREYVKSKVGSDYLIKLYGTYQSPHEIDYESLPDTFVLKCNHDSGSTIICRDKKTFDKREAARRLGYALRRNFYHINREHHYRDIPPLILCEELLPGNSHFLPEDYKIFVFNNQGDYKIIIQLVEGRLEEYRTGFFTDEWELLPLEWELIPFKERSPLPKRRKKPEFLNEMIEAAKKLGEDFDFVRVDFYQSRGRLCVGELTFTPCSGCKRFYPDEWDYRLGSYWVLKP